MRSSTAEDPRLKKRSTNNKFSSQEHHVGGKRRIGRNIDQEAAATSSKELHVSLQAEQEALAKDRLLAGALLTGELQQTFADQQLRAKSVEIKAHIDTLQASIDVHNNPADVKKLRQATRDLREITPLPRPTSWQAKQMKQDLL
jgi:hypothetical protein